MFSSGMASDFKFQERSTDGFTSTEIYLGECAYAETVGPPVVENEVVVVTNVLEVWVQV